MLHIAPIRRELLFSIDIVELFTGEAGDVKGKAKAEQHSPTQAKTEPVSPTRTQRGFSTDSDFIHPPSATKGQASTSKPKPGRLVSNQRPLEDFNALIEGEGDVFRKAIQDLGAVVKENVEASFSRQAFPLALECLKAMRKTALVYEEVDTFNESVVLLSRVQIVMDRAKTSSYLAELEAHVKAPGFKHPDFWNCEF